MLVTKLTKYTPKKETIPVPELGEGAEIILLEMVGERAKAYAEFLRGLGEGETFSRTVFLVFSMVNTRGKQCHSIEEIEAIEESLPPKLLNRLVHKSMEINGLIAEDIHKKKDE
ncbi:hypothetical protein [Methylophaga sp.]|uniref:hypothetical protein n=1 Tax=Methylophaga sp. TaxID=2024840 RepID=UPI003A8CFD5B